MTTSVAIIYHSRYGHTARVAEAIAEGIGVKLRKKVRKAKKLEKVILEKSR
jgi:flavodoxin